MAVRYVLWPKPPLQAVSVGDRKTFPQWVVTACLVSAVMCLPVVRGATGIGAGWVVGLFGVHLLWSAFVVFGMTKTGEGFRSRRALDVSMAGNLLLNTFICVALCVASGDPRTPLWMLPVLYATLNGSIAEAEPSIALLAVHVLAPMAAIPVYRATGSTTGWSIAGPVLCAAVSAAGYHTVAMATARWRGVRAEQEATVAAFQAKLAERDRTRLAQDLHDSIGSVLGVVALYADLIERNRERPDELRAIADMVREATREGLTDLRSVIGAIAPASTDVAGVARALRPITERVDSASGTDVTLTVEGDGGAVIGGPARLAVVRVFQEALANATRHGEASQVRVVLRSEGPDVRLEVHDDGKGFDLACRDDATTDGRGLRGMRERVEELGGSFELESEPGRGTRVRVRVPRSGA